MVPTSLTFDHAQKRIQRDRIALAVGGPLLDGVQSSCVYDLVTGTTFLQPTPNHPNWTTTNSGLYAKLALGDYVLVSGGGALTAPDWVAHQDGGRYFAKGQNTNGAVITTATYTKNRGFWIAQFGYNNGGGYGAQLECGWSNTGDLTAGVGIRKQADGTVQVFKGGVVVGEYKVSGNKGNETTTNQVEGFYLIPCRQRELLVLSTLGDGFTHVFEDIDPDDTAPVITPATKFWWKSPSATPQIECAPLQYPSSGYVLSVQCALAEIPEIGRTLESFTNPAWVSGSGRIMGHPAYDGGTQAAAISVVKLDGTAFTPDGVTQNVRLKIALSGDNLSTPFINGAYAAYAPVYADTNATEEYVADDHVMSQSLDVPDSATGVSVSYELDFPETLDAGDIPKLLKVSNRPVKLSMATQIVVDGVSDVPEYEEGITDEVSRAHGELRDAWERLERYEFREQIPLGGLNLSKASLATIDNSALQYILQTVLGPSFLLALEDVSFVLPNALPDVDGKFPLTIEIGDKAAQWVQRLIEDYAATYFYGFTPLASGYTFEFKSPTVMNAAADVYHLYPDIASAIAAGFSEADARYHVYRHFRKKPLKPEANEVRVTGYDPALDRGIQSFKIDTASQDPTVAPSSRPDNWLGEPSRYGLADAAITTQTASDQSVQLLYDRVTPLNIPAEWDCEMMIKADGAPVWRGQNVLLHGQGRFRILSLSTQFTKEPDPGNSDDWNDRETHYCGLLIPDAE